MFVCAEIFLIDNRLHRVYCGVCQLFSLSFCMCNGVNCMGVMAGFSGLRRMWIGWECLLFGGEDFLTVRCCGDVCSRYLK